MALNVLRSWRHKLVNVRSLLGSKISARNPKISSGQDQNIDSETEDDLFMESAGTGDVTPTTPRIPPLLPVPVNLASPTDKLCDVCKALQLSAERFVVVSDDTKTLDETEIDLGLVVNIVKKTYCPLCRLVMVALGGSKVPSFEDGVPVRAFMNWFVYGAISDQSSNAKPLVRVLMPNVDKLGGGLRSDDLNLMPEITLLANDSPSPSTTFLVRPILQDKIDFGMVRNWVLICENWHAQACNKALMLEHETSHLTDVIPGLRFVDVVENCLVPGVNNTKYVTLSYVWGTVEFIQTLKKNVARLQEPGALNLPEFYDKIPWTIRDAMQVVRELGLRYLWVDSLCIVQDDNSRQKVQSIKKMDMVYSAAFLNIMAISGLNANAGLPGVRPGTRGYRQQIEEIKPGLRLAFKDTSYNHIANSVYFTRGWTFQERYFSKRRLEFSGGQVTFKCLNNEYEWRENLVFEDDSSILALSPSMEKAEDDIHEVVSLISDYSEQNLTFPSDIYFAFAGVSRYITQNLECNLYHGMPEAFFDWFLLWTSPQNQTRRQALPSWSWSGWFGVSYPNIWDWFTPSIKEIRRVQAKRTWVIWYAREAIDSGECSLVWTHENSPSTTRQRNFYGEPTKIRFPFDCSSTVPTLRARLTNPPTHLEDSLNPLRRTGFLQFWTVSVTLRLDTPTSPIEGKNITATRSRVGIFGQSHRELGIVFLNEDWCSCHVPGEHELILICEGRDERAKDGRTDDEEGWKYMAMLLEWHGEWAERVGVGSIEKHDLHEALGGGPVWKEIILG